MLSIGRLICDFIADYLRYSEFISSRFYGRRGALFLCVFGFFWSCCVVFTLFSFYPSQLRCCFCIGSMGFVRAAWFVLCLFMYGPGGIAWFLSQYQHVDFRVAPRLFASFFRWVVVVSISICRNWWRIMTFIPSPMWSCPIERGHDRPTKWTQPITQATFNSSGGRCPLCNCVTWIRPAPVSRREK